MGPVRRIGRLFVVHGSGFPDHSSINPAGGPPTSPGATAYARATTPQRDAVARLSALAAKIDNALTVCAGAGVAFYDALGAIVVKFVIALVAAIAALASRLGAPIALVILCEEFSVNTAMIVAAVTTLGAVLATQTGMLASLHGEAVDTSTFPHGHWPNPVTTA